MNTFRTGILLAALTAIFAGVGFLVGGPPATENRIAALFDMERDFAGAPAARPVALPRVGTTGRAAGPWG
jgi:hypothetical protein